MILTTLKLFYLTLFTTMPSPFLKKLAEDSYLQLMIDGEA